MPGILISSLVFPPDGVSTAYVVGDLAVDLAAMGHQVTVVTTTPHFNIVPGAAARQPMRRRLGGLLMSSRLGTVPVWHVRMPRRRGNIGTRLLFFAWFHAVSLVLGSLFLRGIDVVVSVSPPLSIGLVGAVVGRFRRRPAIYWVQELYPDMAIREGMVRNPLAIRTLKALEKLIYRLNSAVFVITEQFAAAIRQRTPDVPVFLAPNSVDTEFYRPMPGTNRFGADHGLGGEFTVLYAGNIGIAQDWSTFVDVLGLLATLPISFLVVGGGTQLQWLRERIAGTERTNVTLVDYVDNREMPLVNACADICLLPMTTAGSLCGFPSKILTNMASAKVTVVGADPASDLARFVIAADAGDVVAPGDAPAMAAAIKHAFDHQHDLEARGRRAREYAQLHLSRSAVSGRFDALLRRVMSESR